MVYSSCVMMELPGEPAFANKENGTGPYSAQLID